MIVYKTRWAVFEQQDVGHVDGERNDPKHGARHPDTGLPAVLLLQHHQPADELPRGHTGLCAETKKMPNAGLSVWHYRLPLPGICSFFCKAFNQARRQQSSGLERVQRPSRARPYSSKLRVGAFSEPAAASNFSILSNPNIPAKMAFGKRRTDWL